MHDVITGAQVGERGQRRTIGDSCAPTAHWRTFCQLEIVDADQSAIEVAEPGRQAADRKAHRVSGQTGIAEMGLQLAHRLAVAGIDPHHLLAHFRAQADQLAQTAPEITTQTFNAGGRRVERFGFQLAR